MSVIDNSVVVSRCVRRIVTVDEHRIVVHLESAFPSDSFGTSTLLSSFVHLACRRSDYTTLSISVVYSIVGRNTERPVGRLTDALGQRRWSPSEMDRYAADMWRVNGVRCIRHAVIVKCHVTHPYITSYCTSAGDERRHLTTQSTSSASLRWSCQEMRTPSC